MSYFTIQMVLPILPDRQIDDGVAAKAPRFELVDIAARQTAVPTFCWQLSGRLTGLKPLEWRAVSTNFDTWKRLDSDMQLVDAFTYRVRTTGPLKTTRGSPAGERSYWIVSEAELDGPNIKAKLAAPGSDWM